MLSVAWEGFGGTVVEDDGRFLDESTIWEYLTHRQARSSLNMWYNLDFDANVVLSHILSKEELAELTVNGSVGDIKEGDSYEITFIPGKFMKIRDKNDNFYTHYDAAQFFYAPLDIASKEWLGKEKDDVDASKFGLFYGAINSFIRENYSDIKKYARKDAELVRDIWQEAVNVGEDLDIPMGKPFSTGYLAESYLNHQMHEKPGLGPNQAATMAWEAYAGGRFEVFKRGNIGEVVGPDINSAYPHILAGLPDPKTLRWERHDNPDIETLREADYGFVTATVTTDESRTIQPFAVKVNDILSYPALEGYEITVIKDIFVNAYDYDYLEDFEVAEAWLGYDTRGTKYPFDFIDPMYEQRKEFESQGYTKRAMLLKIILNSMYGKTCQTTPKRKKITERIELSEQEDFVGSLSLPKFIREKFENGFVEWLECGSWFNPFLASYITGMTRLELHKRMLEYGLEDHTVMFATDSVMIEKEAFDQTNFKGDLVKSGLGNWDYDYEGKAFVIGAGVYEVEMTEETKTQTRGFREADLGGKLREEAKEAEDTITVESTRPSTVAEAIWMNQEVSSVGSFRDFERDISPDMDNKRRWGYSPSFKDLLRETQESNPIIISGSE